MDFASLLSKEIDRKRKSAGSSQGNKRAKAGDGADTVGPGARPDSPIVETQARDEAADQGTTPEEQALVDSVSDAQVDAKLAQFEGMGDVGDTKLDKIRKLEVLVKSQQRNERYQKQLEQEAGTDQAVKLEDITNSDLRDKLHTQVRIHIKHLVREWQDDIQHQAVPDHAADDDAREDQRETLARRAAVLLDTKKDLVKLLYKLRSHQLGDSMLTSLATIVYYLQTRDYRRANESYMKLSIGNVAWPIGVRSVGIHERSAASKITGENKQNSANIMLDDKTRRWITAVKRLITFTERRWPI